LIACTRSTPRAAREMRHTADNRLGQKRGGDMWKK
jgi:hypothetical protein